MSEPGTEPKFEGEELIYELARAALELNGRFAIRDIYDYGAGTWSHNKITETAKAWEYDFETEEPVIELDGGRYILAPPLTVKSPRILVAVNGNMPKSLNEVYGR